jgi:hypothetical protein
MLMRVIDHSLFFAVPYLNYLRAITGILTYEDTWERDFACVKGSSFSVLSFLFLV